jgi:spermidine/putrescine transport system ATP-binding protein
MTSIENDKNGPVLEIKNVTKQFGDLVAVDNVSIEIPKGEIFSLLGPSGCGKTTLLRIVAGFEYPDKGDIILGGKKVNNLPPDKRECNIVFQQHALFPHMTVFDNIGFGLTERRLPKNQIKKLVNEAIDFVNLTGMEKRYPAQLSGGQQQRVALSRSLVLQPKILLLDEPLASLDRKLRKEMQTELKRIQREVGITFLNVTHDQKEALSMSDKIAVMRDGAVIQMGSPRDIYETPGSQFVASFIGASNIFKGRVEAEDNDRFELKTDSGQNVFIPKKNRIAKKDITGFSIHPELISISWSPADNKELSREQYTILKGTVKESFYQGEFSEVTIELSDIPGDLTVHLNRGTNYNSSIEVGDKITAYWDWKHNNVLGA